MEPKIYYKQVAVIQGKYFSVHDPNIEYEIGKEMKEKPKPMHKGGYFVYPTKELAASADISNKLGSNWLFPRSILKVQCWGDYISYPRFKLCFEYLKPLKDLGFPKQYLTQQVSFKSESFVNDSNNESIWNSHYDLKSYTNLPDPYILNQNPIKIIQPYHANYKNQEEKQANHRLNLHESNPKLLNKPTYFIEKSQNKDKTPNTRSQKLKAETKQLEQEVLEMELKARKMGINI